MESNNAYHIRRMAERTYRKCWRSTWTPSQPVAAPDLNSFHHEMRNKLAHYVVVCRGSAAADNGHRVIGLREVLLYLRQFFTNDVTSTGRIV